jgi:hypothetical protein
MVQSGGVKRKPTDEQPRQDKGGKCPKDMDGHLETVAKQQEDSRARTGGKSPKDPTQAQYAADHFAQKQREQDGAQAPPVLAAAVDATKQKRAKKGKAEPTVKLQRLFPSGVRQQADDSGMVPHPHSNVLVNPDEAPMETLEEMYILRANNINIVRVVSYDEMVKCMSLPKMAVGQAPLLQQQKTEGIPWTYASKPLVRGIHPDSSFETNLRNNGFSSTKAILVVPCLTAAEEEEYLKDAKAFREGMQADAFYHERSFWIVDGATRFTLCSRQALLRKLFFLSA